MLSATCYSHSHTYPLAMDELDNSTLETAIFSVHRESKTLEWDVGIASQTSTGDRKDRGKDCMSRLHYSNREIGK